MLIQRDDSRNHLMTYDRIRAAIISFIKENRILVSSSLIANLIRVVTVVIITRIYIPSEFGKYQIILSISLLLSSIGTFKYDYGIVLSQDKNERGTITSLSVMILLAMTVLIIIIITTLVTIPIEAIALSDWHTFLWFVPIIFLFAGAEPLFRNIFLANRDYARIGQINLLKTSMQQGLIIFYGVIDPSAINLIAGYLSGYLITYIFMINKIDWSVLSFKRDQLMHVIKKYKKLPVLNGPTSLLAMASAQTPIIMLGLYFSPSEVGLYAFAMRLLDIPLQIINSSTTQTYFRNLSLVKHIRDQRISLFKKYFGLLFIFSLIFVILAYYLSEPIFLRMFGAKWTESIILFKVMLPVVILKYPTSSISLTTTAMSRQEINILWTLLLVAGSALVIAFNNSNIVNTVGMMVAVYSSLNLLYIFHIYSSLKNPKGVDE